MTIKKVTVLEGFYATGDYEAFCFDKHKGPEEHLDYLNQNHPRPQEPEGAPEIPKGHDYQSPEWTDFWDQEQAWSETPAMKEYQRLFDERDAANDKCRVYPNTLLPEGTDHQKGTWTITIEFTPDSNS